MARLLLPATTNIVPNPVFAVDLSGWSQANTTPVRDTSWSVTGPASCRIAPTGSGAGVFPSPSITIPAETYTISGIVRNVSEAAITVYVRYNSVDYFSDGITIQPGEEALIAKTVTGTGTATSPSIRSTAGAGTWLLGYMQVEPGSTATDVCPRMKQDGTLLPGYAWTGTANASPSTREAIYAADPVSTVLGTGTTPLALLTPH